MKNKNYFLLFFILISFSSTAHRYYFSFAEIEFNDFSSCFEVTLSVTTHDFEQLLRKEGILIKDIDHTMQDSLGGKAVEAIINNSFQIFYFENQLKLKIESHINELTGITNFYMSSEKTKMGNELNFNFPLLMNLYPEQQNKLTFIHRGIKTTANFISTQQKQLIKLEK